MNNKSLVTLFSVLVPIFSALFILIGSEIVVRTIMGLTDKTPIVSSDQLTGWRGRPNLNMVRKNYRGGFFTISTDKLGRRITPNTSEKAPILLLVGDSFTQGVGVADDETFGWLLGSKGTYRVVNLGVAGFGTDQELLSAEQYLEASKDRISDVVLLVFVNDFVDVLRSFDPSLGRSKPIFGIDGQGRLMRSQFILPLADSIMDYSRLWWLVRSKTASLFSQADLPLEQGDTIVLQSVLAMRSAAEAKGARLHIYAYRGYERRRTIPDSTWKRIIDSSEARDVTPDLSTFGLAVIGFDGTHWNAEGHKVFADLVLSDLQQR